MVSYDVKMRTSATCRIEEIMGFENVIGDTFSAKGKRGP